MYKTTVTPDTGKPFEAQIDYTIWSEVFTCPHCGGEVVFYDAAFNPETGKVRDDFSCPACGAQLTKSGLERRTIRSARLLVISSSGSSFGQCESPGGSDRGSGRSRSMSTIVQCWRRSDASVSPDSRPPSCRSNRWCTAPGSGRRGSRGYTISGRIVRSRALRCCGRGPRRNPIQARPLRCASGSSRHSGACPG